MYASFSSQNMLIEKLNIFFHSSRWELNDDFCWTVRQHPIFRYGPLLMDFIDAAVFDYIISNADRHTYETFREYNHSMLVMLDSGKR